MQHIASDAFYSMRIEANVMAKHIDPGWEISSWLPSGIFESGEMLSVLIVWMRSWRRRVGFY